MEDRVLPQGRCNKATDLCKMIYRLKTRIETDIIMELIRSVVYWLFYLQWCEALGAES
jgi:hypothetical protein